MGVGSLESNRNFTKKNFLLALMIDRQAKDKKLIKNENKTFHK